MEEISKPHANFLAHFGTEKHKDKLMDYKNGRQVIASSKKTSDETRDKLLNHPEIKNEPLALSAIAETGNHDHRKKIVNMPEHTDMDVSHSLGRYGNKEVYDKLADHPNKFIRAEVAKRGNDSHRDKLIDDSEHVVRAKVAEYGTEKHRDKLLNDPHPSVRMSIANYGEPHQVEHLKNDKDEDVAEAANSEWRPEKPSKYHVESLFKKIQKLIKE